MKPDKWKQVEELLESARSLPPQRRSSYLSEACGTDDEVRREVESLIAHMEMAGSFLERPPSELASELLVRGTPGLDKGQTVAGYSVVSRIGGGGMGEVYLAKDLRLNRDVALKVLAPVLAAEPAYRIQFEAEAQLASNLNHPNIVTIYAVGDDNGMAFIAMEFVRGKTLRQELTEGPTTAPRALDISVQIADALTVAHGCGVVHRDLKPENVMITAEGFVKVLDFGLARKESLTAGLGGGMAATMVSRTGAGMILGTVGYMSPEQASGKNAGPTADLFSFGTILYELLTGQRAFQRETAVETLSAIIRDEPPRVKFADDEASESLCALMDRCLAKDPENRYAHTDDLAKEIRRIRDIWPEDSRGVALERRPGMGRRRAIWLTGAAVVSGAFLFLATQIRRPEKSTYVPDPEAHSLYVRAMNYQHRADEAGYLESRELLNQAVARDPQFALAFVGLASSYTVAAVDGYESPVYNAPLVRSNIQKAVDLDPNLIEVHYALASEALCMNWDWKTAEKEFHIAEAVPAAWDADAAVLFYWAMGRNDDALRLISRALYADALNLAWRLKEADLLASVENYNDAAKRYEAIIHDVPTDSRAYFGLAEVRRNQKRFDDAIDLIRVGWKTRSVETQEPVDETMSRFLAKARGSEGFDAIEKKSAQMDIDRLEERRASGEYASPLDLARAYGLLNDREKALQLLEAAYEERSPGLVFLKVDPSWKTVRQDARFAKLVRRVGLP